MDAKLIMTVEEMEDRDIWMKLRNSGIGGSDAGVIAGLNRWKSPYQLWLEKTGQVEPEDLSDNEYVYWGTVLEQVVADSYYLQCQHYMMATGCEKWYIACLIGGNHFVYKEIPRNEDDITSLYAAEKAFWTVNVKGGIMPEVDGSDSCTAALRERFPGGSAEEVTLPDAAAAILDSLDQLKETKKDIEEQIKKAQNEICVMLGDCEVGYVGERKVTWKAQAGRVTVDSKKLKAEKPEIFAAYSKQGNPIRVFKA